MIDSRKVEDLHPILREGLAELKRRVKIAYPEYSIKVTSTYRDHERQNEIYAQGRNVPGRVVTYARGGCSYHNHRLAFDICEATQGYDDLDFFYKVGAIWREMGGEWGGDWQPADMPHFQYDGGLTINNLIDGRKLKAGQLMKWQRERQPEPTAIPEAVEPLVDMPKFIEAVAFLTDSVKIINQAGYWLSSPEYHPNFVRKLIARAANHYRRGVIEPDEQVRELAHHGIIDSPDYWINTPIYKKEFVQLLIVRMAEKMK